MDQTNVFAETWENTFKITPNNNSNWLNLNKVTSWINNNKAKTSPYKKVNLARLNNNNTLTCSISTDEINFYITKMKKKAPGCLLYTSPSPRDQVVSRMPSSA